MGRTYHVQKRRLCGKYSISAFSASFAFPSLLFFETQRSQRTHKVIKKFCDTCVFSFLSPPDSRFAVIFKLDVNHIRPATDGAVFDVLLALSFRGIERNDDLFAAGVANVTRIVLHVFILRSSASVRAAMCRTRDCCTFRSTSRDRRRDKW